MLSMCKLDVEGAASAAVNGACFPLSEISCANLDQGAPAHQDTCLVVLISPASILSMPNLSSNSQVICTKMRDKFRCEPGVHKAILCRGRACRCGAQLGSSWTSSLLLALESGLLSSFAIGGHRPVFLAVIRKLLPLFPAPFQSHSPGY